VISQLKVRTVMEFSFDGPLRRLHHRGRDLGRIIVEPSVVTRDRRAAWDPELLHALAEAGMTGLLLPLHDGGLSLTVLEAVSLLEGFGEGAADPGLALSLGVHGQLFGVPIATLGTPAQRDRHLPAICSGARIGALALSEVDGGAVEDGAGVTAVPAGDGWRLEGALAKVINGPHAHHFLLTADTGGDRTAFLIDRDAAGIAVLPDSDATSLRTAPSASLVLTGCQVGSDAVLGTPGAARTELVPLLAALDRTCLLAPWLGLLRALVRHILDRVPGLPLLGGTLARSQSVRMSVVDLFTSVELGSGLLSRAAWQLGNQEPTPRMDAAAAKMFLARAVREAADAAAGLADFAPHHLVERTHRDVLALNTRSGNEVLRSVVAGALLELG
jgi:alkylation response protein AidB-like acyl-CoA dehydrogenase